MKKIGTTFALYMVLCTAVFAQNANDFKTDGKGLITGYDGWDTVIVIPDRINGVPITMIGEGAFKNMGLTSITLPAGIEYIGKEAFYGNKLTSLTLPDNVSWVGEKAFSNNQLTNLTIGNSKYLGIFKEAFSNNQLTSLTLGNIVHIDEKAFSNNKLTRLTIGNDVSINNYAFSKNQLTSVTIGNDVYIGNLIFFDNQDNKLTGISIGDRSSISSSAFSGYENRGLKNLVLGADVIIEISEISTSYSGYGMSFRESVYYDYICNGRKAGTYDNTVDYADKTEGDYYFIQTKYGAVITGYRGSEGSRLLIPQQLGGTAVKGIGFQRAHKNLCVKGKIS